MDILTNRILLTAVPLLVAVVLTLVVRRRGTTPQATPGLRWGALAVLAAWALPTVLSAAFVLLPSVAPGTVLEKPDWGRFPWQALPVVAAAVVAAALLVRSVRAQPDALPATRPLGRRTWSTFAPRGAVVLVAVLAALLAVVSIGAASQTVRDGSFEVVYLPDGGWTPFPGWVAATWTVGGVLLLLALAWSALHADALRPFRSPNAVAGESRDRRTRAGGLLVLAASALALGFGGYLEAIARAGNRVSAVGGAGDDVTFITTDAPFAPALGVLGFIVQLAALTALWGVVFASSAARTRSREAVSA